MHSKKLVSHTKYLIEKIPYHFEGAMHYEHGILNAE